MFRITLLLMLAAVLLTGCGEEKTAVTPVTPPGPAEQARSILETAAQTGELGSAAESLRTSLEELKATDPAKADALLADLDKLEAARSPDAIKSQAQAMLGKL